MLPRRLQRLPRTVLSDEATLHEVYLALAKTPIEGPGGIEAAFDFRAAYNATATTMMMVMLRICTRNNGAD